MTVLIVEQDVGHITMTGSAQELLDDPRVKEV